jgi:uncharacterized protein YndB with AHSA1/START domain
LLVVAAFALLWTGRYRTIEPDARLVFTEVFDDQSYPGETVITSPLPANSPV